MKETSMAHLPGKFAWFEHSSNSPAKARKFYEPLFNWNTESMPMDHERYPMIFNGSQRIGGYRAAAEGARSQWIAYLSVHDLDGSFAAALAAGARAIARPAQRGPVGHCAHIADPSGAVLSLWESSQGDRPDADATARGDWYWNELWTDDPIRALAFYQRVFGYGHDTMQMSAHGTYYLLKKDGVSRAGMIRSADRRAPSMWLPYVCVDDCDATAHKACQLGGEVLSAPRDVPGIGRHAVLADTLGAAIAVIRPEPAVNAQAQAAITEATAA
jgi:predicted enzyme related to lactoylglutathione lyase